jgi:hypothetical protein
MNKVYMFRWRVGDKNDKRFWVHPKTQELPILESFQPYALGPSRPAIIPCTCKKSMIMTWNDPHGFTIITSLVYIFTIELELLIPSKMSNQQSWKLQASF